MISGVSTLARSTGAQAGGHQWAGGQGAAGTFTPQPGAEEHVLPCWPPPGPAGTFIVARML